jgi:hypothetical protein
VSDGVFEGVLVISVAVAVLDLVGDTDGNSEGLREGVLDLDCDFDSVPDPDRLILFDGENDDIPLEDDIIDDDLGLEIDPMSDFCVDITEDFSSGDDFSPLNTEDAA